MSKEKGNGGFEPRVIEGGVYQPEVMTDKSAEWELDISKHIQQIEPNFTLKKGQRVMLSCVPRAALFIFCLVDADGSVSSLFEIGGLVGYKMKDQGLPPSKDDLSCLEAIEKMLSSHPEPLAKKMLEVANIGRVRRMYNFALREAALKNQEGM
ncbi:hypothetical protein IT411_04105 [Candidatus Peregrinibacteria bacterium]|nr:hypothetical protein [Candidatus Peregrinibacteria bacterium]